MEIITIDETCECNICWEIKHKFKKLKCNHQICTQCFPQIRNNLCPFCREPFVIRNGSRSIGIINRQNQEHQSFSNLSLDDNLLLEFANSFNDLHIRQENRRERNTRRNNRRRNNRRHNNRRRNNRGSNNRGSNNRGSNNRGEQTNDTNEISEQTNDTNEISEQTNEISEQTNEISEQIKNRKKSKIKNRKRNRWNTLRNQYRNHHNYANSY